MKPRGWQHDPQDDPPCDGIDRRRGGTCAGERCKYVRRRRRQSLAAALAHRGPGANLKATLVSFGVPACGECSAYAAQMDAWGIAGCRERRAEIIERMRGQYAKLGWAQWLAAKAIGVVTDPVAWLVDGAIDQTEAELLNRRASEPVPYTTHKIDAAQLVTGGDCTAFNASLCRHQGRLSLAYRTGWGGSMLHVAELGEDFTPQRVVSLPWQQLYVPGRCESGREDPRLFVFRGRLHLAYIGVVGDPGNTPHGSTSVLFARLRDDLTVERVLHPHYPDRHPKWEKNCAPFDADGNLCVVYTVSPHRVLTFRDDGGGTAAVHDVGQRIAWAGGAMRGGAAPVRMGDVYYHWFHGWLLPGPHQGGYVEQPTYSVGCYVFEASPPFRVRRYTPHPLVWGQRSAEHPNKSIVFPCGAIYEHGRWLISAGVADRRIEVYEFATADVEKAMVPT